MKGKEKSSKSVVGPLFGCTNDEEKSGPSPCERIAEDLPQVKQVTFDESKECNSLEDLSDRKLCERMRELLREKDEVPKEVVKEIFKEYFEEKTESLFKMKKKENKKGELERVPKPAEAFSVWDLKKAENKECKDLPSKEKVRKMLG